MLSENFKNISLETQVSFVTSRNNLKTFSGLVIISLRFLTWHSSTSCMLPYSALNKTYKVSLLTPYFNNHKWVPFTQSTRKNSPELLFKHWTHTITERLSVFFFWKKADTSCNSRVHKEIPGEIYRQFATWTTARHRLWFPAVEVALTVNNSVSIFMR